MTTLYRTPNIVIDEFEWHGAVELKKGRVHRRFRFRPLSHYVKPTMWLPLTSWRGHKPKDEQFRKAFQPFRRHMTRAERSIVENARRARGLAA